MKKIIWLLLVALVFTFSVTALAEEAHTHSFIDAVLEEATCTKAGVKVRACLCGYSEEVTIPAKGHSWTPWVGEEGSEQMRVCTVCGEMETKAPTGCSHTYGEWKVTTAATCTTAGSKTRTCTKCNDAQTETIVATGHAYGEWKVTTAATCTTDGVKTSTCANCNDAKTETMAATGHTWGEWKEEGGIKTRTCSACGKVEKDESGCIHTYGAWKVSTDATCTKAGEKIRICSKCSDIQTEAIAATGHNWDAWKEEVKATCEKAGSKIRVCKACGEVERETVVIPHTYEDWNVTAEATCAKAGEKMRICTVCSYIDKVEIAKLPHTETVIPGKAATCTEKGITDGKKCTACGEITVEQKEIAPKGHTEVEIPAVAATCEENGLTAGKKCSVCNAVLVAQTEIKAIGHKYVVKVIAPTTTSRGYNANRCKNCGNFFRSNYVDKLAAEVTVDYLTGIVFDAEMNPVAYTATATVDAEKVLTVKAEAVEAHTVRILSLTFDQVELLKADGVKTIVFVVGEHELVIPMDVFAQEMLVVARNYLGEAALGYNFTVACGDAACTMKVEIKTAGEPTDVTAIVTGVELK